MRTQDPIYVAGGDSLAGAAILRRLAAQGYRHVVGGPGDEPPLTDASAVDHFFARMQPRYVFLAGGPAAGIAGNQRYPADLMRENLLVATHVISSAYRSGVTKLLYLASSCCYPRLCPQPMREEHLFSGPLEPTNDAYAMAKLAGIKLCEAYARQHGVRFLSAIPANPFGPGDDFDPETSHVIPGLIARIHRAKEDGVPSVTLWGTGAPQREFIFVEDLADACIHVMQHYEGLEPINLGSGHILSIRELAQIIAEVVGYRGAILFDPTKPDGMPVKILDSGPLREMGWRPRTPFRDSLELTYRWYVANAPMTERTRVRRARPSHNGIRGALRA